MLRYLEIKHQLQELIETLPTGTKLTPRIKLCKQLDTTRATLDKALRELEVEGYLASRKGSGTYVSSIPSEKPVALENWGVIVPNIMDPIYPGLVRGIENVAQSYGLSITLCNSDNSLEKQEMYIKRLILLGVSGFIIVPVVSNSLDDACRLYRQLCSGQVPFVFCNRGVDGIDAPVVTSNSYYGGYIATRHLIHNEYKKIAYISKTRYSTSIERLNGCISAILESGLEVRDEWMVLSCGQGNDDDVYVRLRSMLDKPQRPDAVFCFNDKIAAIAYRAVRDLGLRVSDDVGIIGYDNAEINEARSPALSSVAYKNVEIGEYASKLLFRMTNGERISDLGYTLFQPEVIQRESCLGPCEN